MSFRVRACVITARAPDGAIMKTFFVTAAALVAGITLADASPASPESGDQWRSCTARVLYSRELPFAPEGKWLVKVTLEITPPNGSAYAATLQEWMPWQGPPPRRRQALRLLCNPAHPNDLHLISQPPVRSAF